MTEQRSSTRTFLFTDIEGSTALLRRLKDRYVAILTEHRRLLREAFAASGGRELDAQGDSLFVEFRRPVDALRAAVAGQRALVGSAWPEDAQPSVRIGMDTGEAAKDDSDRYIGLVVHRAARICAAGHGGQILLSQATYALLEDADGELDDIKLRDLGEHPLRGFERPARLYQAVVEGLEASFPPLRLEGSQVLAEPVEEKTNGKVRVVIVDDQALVRAGFRMILEAETDVVVVGEASDGGQAVDEVRRLKPDVVLMDVRMPELDGIEATRRLVQEPSLETKVVMLTTFDMDEYVYEALRAGASGFLLKDVPPEQLVAGIRAVASGDALLAPSVTRRVIEEFVRRPPQSARPLPAELEELTEREREVLRHMARGLSNAEIAKELFVSDTTVKTHVARILMKLRLRDRVQAVVFAYENGVVQPGGTG
jgi:DNA-binding NarL/FixJ family response regulator/class 3 adenylate cyclase